MAMTPPAQVTITESQVVTADNLKLFCRTYQVCYLKEVIRGKLQDGNRGGKLRNMGRGGERHKGNRRKKSTIRKRKVRKRRKGN